MHDDIATRHDGILYWPRPSVALRRTEPARPSALAKAESAARGIWSVPPFPDDHRPLDDSWADLSDTPRARRYEVHSLFLLLHLIAAHEASGDDVYLECAAAVIRSWIANNPAESPPSTHSWDGHSSAQRAINLCTYLDHVAAIGSLDSGLASEIVAPLIEHAEFLAAPDAYEAAHNHGIWQDYALLAIATHLRDCPESEAWIDLALKRLQEQIRVGFSAEGVHLENSTAYQMWLVRLLQRIVNYARAVDLPLPAELVTTVERAEAALVSFIMPDGCLPPFGDTKRGLPYRSVDLPLEVLEHRPGVVAYPEAGYCVMRGAIYVLFAATNSSNVHNHCDDLSLIVADESGPILTDPGLLYYERDRKNRYTRARTSHNTVSARSEAHTARPNSLELEAFGRTDSWMACRGRASRDQGIEHERTLLFEAKSGTLVILDRCRASAAQEWERHFLFESDIDLERGPNGTLRCSARDGHDFTLGLCPHGERAGLIRGQAEPLRGWVARENDDLYPAWCTLESQRSQEATFVAVLVPGEKEVDIGLEDSSRFWMSIGSTRWAVVVGCSSLTLATSTGEQSIELTRS